MERFADMKSKGSDWVSRGHNDTVDLNMGDATVFRLSISEAQDMVNRMQKVLRSISDEKNLDRELSLVQKLNTLEDLMNADYSRITGKAHDQFHEVWKKLFPFEQYGVYAGSGYYVGTNQFCPKICMNQNLSFSAQYQKAIRVVGLLKPLPEDLHGHGKGCKAIQIFETTLSKSGIFHLVGYPDGTWKVSVDSWSRSDIKKSGTLDECLQFIYERYPYESKKKVSAGSSEDDDNYYDNFVDGRGY